MHMTKRKKPIRKVYILHDILEKAKLLEAVKRSVAAGGWKVGRDEEIERRMFTGSESTLYDTILVDTRTSLHTCPNSQKGQHLE